MNSHQSKRTRSDLSPGAVDKSGVQPSKAAFSGTPDKRKVEWVPVASLRPHPNNPRTHSPAQIRQIAQSISKFGWTVPVLIDQRGRVIAGHARLEAARLLDFERVPVIRLEHLTEAQSRAYIIADNKLAENAGWNEQLLATELEFLSHIDLDFDLTITGFETAEIDLLIQGIDSIGASIVDDEIPPIDRSTPTVTQVGDLWILGDHHLLCSDATRQASYKQLLGRKKAQMVFRAGLVYLNRNFGLISGTSAWFMPPRSAVAS
jgi:ParB-like chromosome segregation protein Spo0J